MDVVKEDTILEEFSGVFEDDVDHAFAGSLFK